MQICNECGLLLDPDHHLVVSGLSNSYQPRHDAEAQFCCLACLSHWAALADTRLEQGNDLHPHGVQSNETWLQERAMIYEATSTS